MNRLKHRHANAPISRIEMLRDSEGVLCVLEMQNGADSTADTTLAAQHAKLLCDVTHEKNHTRIYRFAPDKAPDIQALATALGGGFEADSSQPKQAPQGLSDLNRWRGIFGTFGQIMQQFAGYREKNPVLNQSSAISMASNLITVGYGTQQRTDRAKTERLRHQADLLLTREQSDYLAPTEAEVKAPAKALSEASKLNRFVNANNMIISDGMKFGSQIFLGTRGNNWVDRTMGHLQWSSKIVTFAGIDKDEDTPESEKSRLTKLRENSNILSGIMEWTGQAFNMLNSVHLKQIHTGSFAEVKADFDRIGIASVKKHYRPFSEVMQWKNWKGIRPSDIRILSPMRFVAVCAFATGFVTKVFAPFSTKTVDWDELEHHAALALNHIPPEERDVALAKLSALYQHAIKDDGLSFGEVYEHLQRELRTADRPLPPTSEAPSDPAIHGARTAALREQRAQTPAAPAMRTGA